MREMKDSGVEWIGEIPKNWVLKRIRDFVIIKNGYPFDSNHFITKDTDEAYPLIRIRDVVRGYTDTYTDEQCPPDYIIHKGDILIGMDGDFNVALWNSGDAFLNQRVCCIDSNSSMLDRRFLFYYLPILLGVINEITPSMTVKHLSTGTLYGSVLVYPTISEQKAIADFLDNKCAEIDALTSDIKSQIDMLEQYKRSVITEAVTKGLNPNAEMKDSGVEWIGSINKDVKLTPLKYLLVAGTASIKVGPFGSQLSGSDLVDEETEYWVYNQRTVLDENYNTGNAFITQEKYDSMEGFHVHTDDILLTTRGSIGKLSRVPENHKKGVLHPCIIRFRIDDSLFDYDLLRLIFNCSDFVSRQLNYKSNATTIDVIYSETLKNIILPVWSMPEQEQIAKYLDDKCSDIDAIIADKQAQLDILAEYKKSLIYEYVTGKKEVPTS